MHKFLIAGTALGVIVACTFEPPEPTAAEFYAERCAACHGPAGRGDGPGAAGSNPAVPDLTRIAARNDGVFPWVEVMNQIDGYSRAGHGMMPEFGDLLLGETMLVDVGDGRQTPTPVRLVELTRYIEQLQRP